MKTNFSLHKREYETWAECVQRYGKPFHLDEDVLESFEVYTSSGMREDIAAFHACYDWDVLPTSPQYKQRLKHLIKNIFKAIV